MKWKVFQRQIQEKSIGLGLFSMLTVNPLRRQRFVLWWDKVTARKHPKCLSVAENVQHFTPCNVEPLQNLLLHCNDTVGMDSWPASASCIIESQRNFFSLQWCPSTKAMMADSQKLLHSLTTSYTHYCLHYPLHHNVIVSDSAHTLFSYLVTPHISLIVTF